VLALLHSYNEKPSRNFQENLHTSPDTGDVYAWGSNTDGCLGLGLANTTVYEPTRVSAVSEVVSVAVGGYDTAFITGIYLILFFPGLVYWPIHFTAEHA
jgi:alpha-tubulin suppressor-like RCC1 family protein